MEMQVFLRQLDTLFQTAEMDDVEAFLRKGYETALAEGDGNSALSILNEQIGFFRVTTQYDKAEQTIEKINGLLKQRGFLGSISEGTSLLNIATAYRAMGKLKEAGESYERAEEIYTQKLDAADYRMAGLYNNKSLFYQEQGDYEQSVLCLKKALSIVERLEDSRIQVAVTHTNLGQAYCKMEDYDAAERELDKAAELFAETDYQDEHYSGCANAQGYLYLQRKDYAKAVACYEAALWNADRANGRTQNFKTIQKNLAEAYRLNGDPVYENMTELCRAYYEKFGKPMLETEFAKYRDRIAVGLCGEGSECFGFADEISTDHDCGPGFALWVEDDVYAEIGERLQEAYEKLPRVFAGYIRTESAGGQGRCGVCRIDAFYERVLGQPFPKTGKELGSISEAGLAAAVNGCVFADPLGRFTEKRNFLKEYYPLPVWREKLAKELIYAAQTGQYNYGRAMARGEFVTAQIVLSEYMQSIMHVVFLLNRTYMPYYKWQHRAVKNLKVLPEVGDILEAICDMPSQRDAWKEWEYRPVPNPEDLIAQTIEIVARLVVHELQEQGLTESSDCYLETQGLEIFRKESTKIENEKSKKGETEQMKTEENGKIDDLIEREKLIDEIVQFEWTEFDQVQNEGGRASCQDNWGTFSIMRKSQYLTWTDEMLSEYYWHLQESLKQGRNLITEKYGRMMESTAPERYAQIKDAFPVLSEKRKQVMEAVIAIQVGWMEEFARQYPKMAVNARLIHTSEDTPYETSYETYLRGELGTYSEELMGLYARHIVELSEKQQNLAYLTMENTAKLYGYDGVEDAEEKLS